MVSRKAFAAAAAFSVCAALSFGNGLNLNSLGSRAGAMGGAFVGLANDFSAVYWNPAGLGFFTTRTFGFYGTDIVPSGSYKLSMDTPIGSLNLVDARTATKHYLGGLFGYVHPVSDRTGGGHRGLHPVRAGRQLEFLRPGQPVQRLDFDRVVEQGRPDYHRPFAGL